MSTRKKVVCTFSPPDRDAIAREFPDIDIWFPANTKQGELMTYEELISTVQNAEGLVHAQINFPMNANVLSALPSSLKIIANHGAGYDGLDVNTATRLGIWVTNTPSVVNNATADIAMFLILAATRRVYEAEQQLRHGLWKMKGLNNFLGNDPRNKVLGIIGLGGIGKALATRAQAFGMRIIYHNRNRLPADEETKLNVHYVSFDELLAESDYISLHCPLTEETYHLIDRPQFEKMKTGVFLVNTSRGSVVNEAALVEALNSGKVSGSGLDVYEKEPLGACGAELRGMANVTLLPHIGTATYESRMDMARMCFENVQAVLVNNRRPTNAINNIT